MTFFAPRASRNIASFSARRWTTRSSMRWRAATNGGWALGDARFKRQIVKALGRRVAPLSKGRPPKAGADRRQLILL